MRQQSELKLHHVFGPTVSDVSWWMVVHREGNLKYVQSSKTNNVANTTIKNNTYYGGLVTVPNDEEWVASNHIWDNYMPGEKVDEIPETPK